MFFLLQMTTPIWHDSIKLVFNFNSCLDMPFWHSLSLQFRNLRDQATLSIEIDSRARYFCTVYLREKKGMGMIIANWEASKSTRKDFVGYRNFSSSRLCDFHHRSINPENPSLQFRLGRPYHETDIYPHYHFL